MPVTGPLTELAIALTLIILCGHETLNQWHIPSGDKHESLGSNQCNHTSSYSLSRLSQHAM